MSVPGQQGLAGGRARYTRSCLIRGVPGPSADYEIDVYLPETASLTSAETGNEDRLLSSSGS